MLHVQNNKKVEQVKSENATDATLSSYSKKDKKWDTHRSQSLEVKSIYDKSKGHKKLGERITECADLLRFAWIPDQKTGELRLKLREARFCRVRYCPICQWRRSLMHVARFKTAMPNITTHYPKHKFILLTLTVRNCQIDDLRQTLNDMNKAWHRLANRKEFKIIDGWVRSTEITRGTDGSAHPHFHCLIMVPPSYFNGKHYLSQAVWTDLWKDCMRLDYTPVVDVRSVKSKTEDKADGAIEVLKYSVKSTDLIQDDDWLIKLTEQTYKLRFLASGGALKDAIKPEKKDEEDMIHTGEDKVPVDEVDDERKDEHLLAFDFRRQERRYRRAVHMDRN